MMMTVRTLTVGRGGISELEAQHRSNQSESESGESAVEFGFHEERNRTSAWDGKELEVPRLRQRIAPLGSRLAGSRELRSFLPWKITALIPTDDAPRCTWLGMSVPHQAGVVVGGGFRMLAQR